jgi:plasmid segregation protein ParM
VEQKKLKVIGADVGNDALKIVLGEGNFEKKIEFEIMNVVAPGYDRRIMKAEKGHLSNFLDVNIEINKKDLGRYFVGGLAFTESRDDLMERTSSDTKADNQDTIILLMTGLAYSLYDPNNLKKTENIAIGTLLPTEEYFIDDLLKKYDENFVESNQYKIKFNSPLFNKAEITLNFVDRDIIPEGTAAAVASTYNTNGSPKADMKNVENEIHLGIDIGAITTDISLLENGEFNTKGFFGLPIGTSQPQDKIIADIKAETGLELTRHQVDYYLRNEKPLKLNVNGVHIDFTQRLKDMKEARYKWFIKLLMNSLNKELSTRGIKKALIDKVNMAGGGSIIAKDYFEKEFKSGVVKLVDNPRFANANGALISIERKLQEKESPATAVLS